jgi:uncharacterized protein (DUF305 family)
LKDAGRNDGFIYLGNFGNIGTVVVLQMLNHFMFRIRTIFFLMFSLAACNEWVDKKTTHQHTTTDTAISMIDSNNMQQLMDDMMNAMHAQKSTGNDDIDYANMMLVHHQGAVKMAELQIEKGTNEQLKEFSRGVVKAQMAEIDSFKRILAVTSPVLSDKKSQFHKDMETSMQPMMEKHGQHTTNIDSSFAQLMIPHHQAAVDMAKAYLKTGTHTGLKKISESIVQSQSREIGWLKQWLNSQH